MLINLCTLVTPVIFSFHPKLGLVKYWKPVWLAIALNAIVFIAWDILFTRNDVWAFNPRYVLGVWLSGLPFEEILFFFCIPYACIFTWFAINKLGTNRLDFTGHHFVTASLVVVLAFASIYALGRVYTVAVCSTTAIVLIFHLIENPPFMTRFYPFFCIILVPFLVINGILTGAWTNQPVVSYDPDAFLAVHVGTIPVEDFVYCLLMMLLNVSLAEKLVSRYATRRKANHPGAKLFYS